MNANESMAAWGGAFKPTAPGQLDTLPAEAIGPFPFFGRSEPQSPHVITVMNPLNDDLLSRRRQELTDEWA
jgi:hypothetical protein